MRPYIFHLMFLVLFGFFNMHVQVSGIAQVLKNLLFCPINFFFLLACLFTQVLTRFVSSSSPVIYWAAGLWILHSLSGSEVTHLMDSHHLSLPQVLAALVQLLWETSRRSEYLLLSKLVVVYFVSYVVIGCALHCNFYPWTQQHIISQEHYGSYHHHYLLTNHITIIPEPFSGVRGEFEMLCSNE